MAQGEKCRCGWPLPEARVLSLAMGGASYDSFLDGPEQIVVLMKVDCPQCSNAFVLEQTLVLVNSRFIPAGKAVAKS